jgi:hypothetical protein
LGYGDYSEWFIGHSGSTYWRKKDSDEIAHLMQSEQEHGKRNGHLQVNLM